ncbi:MULTISPECIES: IS1096 element passenger TnpR family protein [unclassified Endozoicomonas]|uniref:IS1096 element passenger TnpR family protein n=1 Tax=unclassified Endozoicomonas TaxID=2644528 RepID=UPI003BB62209
MTETRLRQLEPVPGMKITFIFDYGDNWEFEIVVMHGSEENTSDIQVIERKGEAPEQYPEYEDFY